MRQRALDHLLLLSRRKWLPASLAGAKFVYDANGSLSGVPGSTYLNGVYYGSFTGAGGTYTGGAGFKTAERLDGSIVGPFASNTPGETNAGLGVWEARTNIAIRSANTSVGWTVNGGSQVTGMSDPLGGTGAGLFTADGSTGTHFITVDGVSFVSGTTYTISVFVKPGSADRVQLTGPSTAFGTSQYANFLLSGAGSVSASAGLTSSAIVALPSGWYRCSITLPASASATGSAVAISWIVTGSEARIPSTASSGSLYFWGTQTEAGSFATPYIPTTSAAATRTADAASITGIGSVLTPPFTVYSETFLPAVDGVNRYIWAVSNSSDGTNRIRTYRNTSNQLISATNSQNIGGASGYTGSRLVRTASRIRADGSGTFSESGVIWTPSTVTLPTGLDRLDIGVINGGGSFQVNGYVRRVLILPDMDDTALAALTA